MDDDMDNSNDFFQEDEWAGVEPEFEPWPRGKRAPMDTEGGEE